MEDTRFKKRKARAKKILSYLKKTYPIPKTELAYKTPFQLVVAVMLSAQCTDKKVNKVTDTLYKKYTTVDNFAEADFDTLCRELSSITYFRNKAKAIIGSALMVRDNFNGVIPNNETELILLPGVAYKTAHVILGELYGIYEGIPTDTHVRRFALRFDISNDGSLTRISKNLEALIPKTDWRYVNNGLVLYGRYVCPARPHECSLHPLTKIWPEANYRWPKTK